MNELITLYRTALTKTQELINILDGDIRSINLIEANKYNNAIDELIDLQNIFNNSIVDIENEFNKENNNE